MSIDGCIESASIVDDESRPRAGWAICSSDEGAILVSAIFVGSRAKQRADAVFELLHGDNCDEYSALACVVTSAPVEDERGYGSCVHVANTVMAAEGISALAKRFDIDPGAWDANER